MDPGSDRLFLGASAAAVPVLLQADVVGVDPEAAQLGSFAQAALELGEAGEASEADDMVPEPGGVGFVGQAAYDRPEERHAVGGLEVDDGGSDVPARQSQRLLGFPLQFCVERGVFEGV